jgi:methyltransferase (TIGR00027 family)
MIEGRPSRSALGMAMHRAAHQVLDQPLVFEDPLALPIVGAEGRQWLETNRHWYEANAPIRAFTVARSLFAEHAIGEAALAGLRQCASLGAGLDTFAYRNPTKARVFEADSPATQAWKRLRLCEAAIAIPDSLNFAPIDFERQTLAEGLRSAGLRSDEPTVFSLLGVVTFLRPETVMAIASYAGAFPQGSALVFDYGVHASALDAAQLAERNHIAQGMASGGEPLLSFFEPAELARALRERGFHAIEELDYQAMNTRFFSDRDDALRVGRNGRRLIRAIV